MFFGNLKGARQYAKWLSSFWIHLRKKDIDLETIKFSIHFQFNIQYLNMIL